MNLNKNMGFSLIEVVIVAGALSGLAVLGMKLTRIQGNSTDKASRDADTLFLINEINATLSNNDNCANTFSTTDTPDGIAVFNKAANTSTPNYIANGKTYLGQTSPMGYGPSSKTQIDSYILTPQAASTGVAGSEEMLKVYVINKKILTDAANSNQFIPKTIKLLVQRDAQTNKVISCHALSSARTDIWQKATGKNIYYEGKIVGINTKSPDHNYALDLRNTTGAQGIDPDTNLPYVLPGNICFRNKYTPSDKNLKENIVTLNDSLEKVLAIRGVSFNWNTIGKHDVGVIAQEVKKQMPEVVSQNLADDLLVVDYQKLLPYLIEAIKSNQREIDSLKKQLNDFQN